MAIRQRSRSSLLIFAMTGATDATRLTLPLVARADAKFPRLGQMRELCVCSLELVGLRTHLLPRRCLAGGREGVAVGCDDLFHGQRRSSGYHLDEVVGSGEDSV